MDSMSFGILVLALTTLVNVGANAVSTECPAMDPTDHTILLAHETDCTKYYSCTGGIKTEMQCSPIDAEGHKLYFNVEKQTCDWPANVKCEMPESIVFIMDPKLDSMNLTVHLAHESDCTKFYKYLGGRKILMECPKDDDGKKLYFNPSLQVCDWHWNVECKHPQPSVLIRLDHPILPVPKECPKVDPKNSTVHLAHESDCTKFYKCSNGKRNLMDCPEDDDGGRLYFNPSLQVCDWHWNVGCKHPQPSVLIRSDHPILPVPKECPRVDPKNSTVHLAHESDCTKFYKCLGGRKIVMDCPQDDDGENLYFNPSLQVCDWRWNVECKHPQPSVLIRSDHPILPVPKECPKVDPKNSTVHLAHESDCTKFYKCFNGKRNLMDCPEDDDGGRLYFNPSLQVCDWRWNVECKHPQPSVLIRSDHPILPVPKECPKVDSMNATVHLAYHKDCTKFYKCSNGKKYPMDCPEDGYGGRLYFNPILQVCVWPEQSGCENGVYPANSSSSSTSTTTSTPMTSSTSITTPSPATSTSTTTSISTSSSTSTTTLPPPSSSTSTTIPPSTSTSTSTATSISTSSSTSTTTPPLSSSSTSTTIPPSTSTSTTTTTPSSTTLEPDPKDCEGDCLNNGLNAPPELNAHKICDKFCVCSSGQHFVASCELGDHWNEEKKACVRGNCTQDHTTPNYDMNDKIDDPLMYVLGYAERLGW